MLSTLVSSWSLLEINCSLIFVAVCLRWTCWLISKSGQWCLNTYLSSPCSVDFMCVWISCTLGQTRANFVTIEKLTHPFQSETLSIWSSKTSSGVLLVYNFLLRVFLFVLYRKSLCSLSISLLLQNLPLLLGQGDMTVIFFMHYNPAYKNLQLSRTFCLELCRNYFRNYSSPVSDKHTIT